MDILSFVQQVTERITALAWALFLLTWSIGWTLRGAPLPISRLKRIGSGLIEDSVWAAFWLAIGSSLFSFIVYIVKMITGG
ncbi:MAG: hypothetical protein G5Z42_00590 [Caldisphaeraceae archaeon]|nr:hypothetical protein [Caldisphaeraceae archaeon]MEB3691243.1 hypothetical protein [Caldisphaeraceae archaeon]MEB3797301.1 hypothetical protein [Caldisphaeraceae archaeon]